MCKIMEDIEKTGYEKGVASKLLRTVKKQLQRKVPYDLIASDNEITVEDVERIAKENNMAY